MPILNDYIVTDWSKGLITRIEGEAQFPKGASEDNLNWLTMGDHIELRRGQAVLGTSISGAGRVTGLRVFKKPNAALTQTVMYTYAKKVMVWDNSSEDFIECGSDILPTAASGEDVAIESYESLAGSFAYWSSPNSSIYKMPVANMGSYIDLKSKSFKGKIRIKKGAMYLWDRKDEYGGSDKTGLYRSWLDKDELSDYPYVSKENIGTGDGVSAILVGTLDSIDKSTAANAKNTAMYLRIGAPIGTAKTITAITKATQAQITAVGHGLSVDNFVVINSVSGMTEINGQIATVTEVVDPDNIKVNINSTSYSNYTSGGTVTKAEVFVDQRDGTMTGSISGTGTINYVTGAYSITASSPITNTISGFGEYYYEDSTNSDSGTADSGAIADFSKSTPREALEGFVIREDDGGGPFQNMFFLGDDDYHFHIAKTWRFTMSQDDQNATNNQYRSRVGIEYWRGAQETSDGIIYIDSYDLSDTYFKRLRLDNISGLAEPVALSEKLDLSNYRFDFGVVYEFGQFIIYAGRTKDSAINNIAFVYNKIWKSFDLTDYRISCADTFNGSLIAGDSGSNNVFTLFSGLTDEESNIPNGWTSGNTDLDVEGIKSIRRCLLAGLIGPDQQGELQLSFDNGPFVAYQAISGDADYVDKSRRVLVGPNTIGTEIIGGGGDGIEAYHYRHEFYLNTDKFEKIRYRFVAKNIGYLSVAELQFKDIRYKGKRAALKYVTE